MMSEWWIVFCIRFWLVGAIVGGGGGGSGGDGVDDGDGGGGGDDGCDGDGTVVAVG